MQSVTSTISGREESPLRQPMATVTTRRTLTSLFTRIRSTPSFSTSSRSRFGRAQVRLITSGSGCFPSDDSSPGCDRHHWLVVMEFPNGPKPSEDEMVDSFVKTLASVLQSEEEAKKKIYSLWTTTNHPCFGALISEELSSKIEVEPGVLWALPDHYVDVPNKDYGGDLFVDGKVIQRPEYRFPKQQQPREGNSDSDSNNQVFKGFSWDNFLS